MQGKFEENPMENPEERGQQTFAFHLSAQSSAVLAHPDELVKDWQNVTRSKCDKKGHMADIKQTEEK